MPRTPKPPSPPNPEAWGRLWVRKGTRTRAYHVVTAYIAERTSERTTPEMRDGAPLRRCKNCGQEYDPTANARHIRSGCIVGEAEELLNHLTLWQREEIEAIEARATPDQTSVAAPTTRQR